MGHELPGVLDGDDEPVTVEELEAVVRRAGQRQRATLVAGAVALLSLGGLVGALARGPVADDPPGGFATESDTAASVAPPPPGVVAVPYGPMPGWTLTPLFRREANGVAIRAYRSSLSPTAITVPEKPVDPACVSPTTNIRGELSNGAAVGMAEAPERPGDDLGVLGSGEFGRDEGEPVAWAIVRAPAGTASVRLKAGPASDTMAPEGGIAVLAVPRGEAVATVEGLDADGKVLATKSLDRPPEPWFSPACAPPPCDVGPLVGPTTVAAPTPPAPAPPPEQAPPPAGPAPTLAPLPPGVASSPSAAVSEAQASCGSFGHPAVMPPPPTTTTIVEGATSPTTSSPQTALAPPPPSTTAAVAAP